MARKMVKQYKPIAKKPVRKPRQRNYVPGWGGVVGRGIGWASRTFTNRGSTANKALSLARKVADMVNVEYKHFDQVVNAVQPDYNGTLVTLNNMAQGTTDATRIGDSIKVQNVIIRGQVVNNATSNQLNRTRIMLIWDEQNQISSITDLLESTGSVFVMYSPKNYDKRFRSIVLYDQVFSTATFTGSQAFFRDFEINLPINKHTQFSAGTTTINTGALKLVLISSGITSNLPSVDGYVRVTYTDD